MADDEKTSGSGVHASLLLESYERVANCGVWMR